MLNRDKSVKHLKKEWNVLANVILIIVAVFCLFPIITLVATTYNTEEELLKYGVRLIPEKFSSDAYKIVFSNPKRILNAYGVTICVTVIGTVCDIIISSMAAYSLARSNYKFQSATSFYLYFTVLFNGGMIPTYWLITQFLHLKNTMAALILPMMVSPWNVFLLRTFFKDTPSALFEAAQIDGANEFVIFGRILLPIARPAIGTLTLMIALSYWNDWYNAMLYIDETKLTTLQLMLQNLTEYINMLKQQGVSSMLSTAEIPGMGVMAVTCLVAAGPMLVVFLMFQKYFIAGMTVGAVKE